MEYYAAERKKELLPFTTPWMELKSIMLSDIIQAVKDKYHMISPISGTSSTKQTNEQNRTRDPLIHRLELNPLSHTSQGYTPYLKINQIY